MLKRTALVVTALTAAVAALAIGSPALAKEGDILVRGSCTGPSTAKLKLSEENGRIEVEFEVDQNRNGVAWTIVLQRNGARVARADADDPCPERLVRGAPGRRQRHGRGRDPRAGDPCGRDLHRPGDVPGLGACKVDGGG